MRINDDMCITHASESRFLAYSTKTAFRLLPSFMPSLSDVVVINTCADIPQVGPADKKYMKCDGPIGEHGESAGVADWGDLMFDDVYVSERWCGGDR